MNSQAVSSVCYETQIIEWTQEFDKFMKKKGIKHIKVAPYYLASNCQAEQAVCALTEGLQKMKSSSI